ncbi:hypothetical protein [uncultured Duncaniella sp.]|uniref:hypothetical protein n=1 Tax=uncultured Duncaniella sp. TaxID=2768039 RepID=UPI0025F221F4|nr:hypothetical protein [uncultured Duncaniella sp.]
MKTINDMKGLLNLAYEIEGLLMLRIERGEEASQEMKNLLVGKAGQLLAGLTAEEVSVVPETADDSAEAVAEAEVSAGVEACAENVVEPPVSVTVAEETAADVADNTAGDDEAVAENALEEERGDADMPVTVNDTLSADSQLTLDEKLARQRAADISKAFTLNDRFRFRRELFRNSDEEFKETVDVIGSMSSMEEAEEYFFNDLCWDETSPVVKEFMAIVGKHF